MTTSLRRGDLADMRGQLRQISLRLSGARIATRQISSVTAGRPLQRGSFQDSTTFDIRSAARHPIDRRLASFKTPVTPVELAYDVTEPKEVTAPGQSLVVCHGLLGSKQNFRSLAKTFAQKLGMPVYTLDLRNHGSSPHVEPHSYEAMATDIAAFFETHNLTSGVNLLGHSMGGKAVMALALNSELNKPLRSLISVDMSPAKGRISSDFSAYTETMIEIESAKVKSKAEADKFLQKVEPSLPTRQFLLTNAKTSPKPDSHIIFRIPLQILTSSMSNIGDFPFDPSDEPPVSWSGPTLFLKGEHSKYINRKNIPVAEQYFPNMRLEALDAGHWVHAEQPLETVRLVQDFLSKIE